MKNIICKGENYFIEWSGREYIRKNIADFKIICGNYSGTGKFIKDDSTIILTYNDILDSSDLIGLSKKYKIKIIGPKFYIIEIENKNFKLYKNNNLIIDNKLITKIKLTNKNIEFFINNVKIKSDYNRIININNKNMIKYIEIFEDFFESKYDFIKIRKRNNMYGSNVLPFIFDSLEFENEMKSILIGKIKDTIFYFKYDLFLNKFITLVKNKDKLSNRKIKKLEKFEIIICDSM